MLKEEGKQKPILLFKKYSLIKKIDEGSFGSIYLAKNIITNEEVAVKVEKRKQYKPLLEKEAYILFYLRGPGLPEIKTFGKTTYYFVLVQTLLGPSLSSLFDDHNINFTIKDICMLSIQMLERLEYIHSKDYIHRDIKPHNFLMGLKDPNMLYIIDFGLAKKYRSKKGKHIKFSITNNIIGTPRYCSYNALRGAEQSRRDDLESLFYVILYFFRGSVPWQNLKIKSRNERFKKINEIKKKINYKLLCKNLPEEFLDFANYIKHLNFEEEPNYKYMQKLFYLILLKIKEENDDKFSWIKSKLIIHKSYHSHKNIFKKKYSVHKRLFEKISNSLEKKLSKRENKNCSTSKNNNSIKDNITLISLNIENLIYDKIKKSNSYACEKVKNEIEGNIQQSMSNLNLKNDDVLKTNFNNNFNNKRMNINMSNNNKNKLIIKRNPTAIKLKNISNILSEEELKNKDYSEMNYFNSNNNESIKNLFLRNNQVLYTSPDLIFEEKPKVNTSRTNINNNFDGKIKEMYKTEKSKNNNIVSKNIIRSYKNKNLNNIKKNIYKSVITENSYSRNDYKIGNYNIYSYEDRNIKNKKNNYNNYNNHNIQSSYNNNNAKYHHLYNNSASNLIIKTNNSNFNNRNNNSLNNIKIYTYNGLNLNLENSGKKIDKVNKGNILPFFNIYKKEQNINKDLTIARKNNIKYNSLKNRNINLNIKLINNNNYNNVPLMIYKQQTNKINNNNNINTYVKQKKIDKKNIFNIINNQMTDKNANINSNRIVRKKIQRKTLANISNKYGKELYNEIGDEKHNNIKILDIPKYKTQLDKKLNLYNYSQ